jgi:hypothetical protein
MPDKSKTTMDIKAWNDPKDDEFHVTIRVPREYMYTAKPAGLNLSRRIDMEQFFGMLEDVVCMKLGIEQPKTNNEGHNVPI